MVLDKVVRFLREEGMTRADIAKAICLHVKDLDSLMFGLVVSPLGNLKPEWSARPPTHPEGPPPQRTLRLVK
jgi:hypothetical protein